MRIRPSFVVLGIMAACSGKGDPARPSPTAPTPGAKTSILPVMEAAKVASVPLPLFQSSQQIAGQEQQQAPWTLTASDGSGLLVTKVEAKAVVQGPLAFTELHLYFHNTEDRVREGTFAITLPSGAAVSRFAMESGGQFMEAEIVEKQLARRAYEDNLHRRQDPALLEKAEGNQFTARVFPIPAKGDKHLVISFSQELPGTRYALPLRGLPKIEALDIRLENTGADGKRTEQKLSQRNWTPDRDFVSDAPTAAEALTSGTYVVAQVAAFDQAQTSADRPTGITLLVDTSASRALGFERYARNVRDLIGSLVATYGDSLQLDLVAFDQDTQSLFSGRAVEVGEAQVRALIERGAAGASDLGQALATLKAPKSRVVVITDGVMTAGANPADLKGAVGRLAKSQVELSRLRGPRALRRGARPRPGPDRRGRGPRRARAHGRGCRDPRRDLGVSEGHQERTRVEPHDDLREDGEARADDPGEHRRPQPRDRPRRWDARVDRARRGHRGDRRSRGQAR